MPFRSVEMFTQVNSILKILISDSTTKKHGVNFGPFLSLPQTYIIKIHPKQYNVDTFT